MREAPSLKSISEHFADSLHPHVVSQSIPEINTRWEFARPGEQAPLRWKTVRVQIDQVSKLVGILFCLPGTKLAEEILPHLDSFSKRTGTLTDFYYAGYGASWPPAYLSDQASVAKVDGVEWFFSSKAFNQMRSDLESHTSWKFSGETDLILLSARRDRSGRGVLSFTPSHACNLEQMAKDQAFSSVRSFLEAIARLAEDYHGNDPIGYLSDRQGVRIGKDFLEGALLSLLPDALRKSYQAAKHHAIRDISL